MAASRFIRNILPIERIQSTPPSATGTQANQQNTGCLFQSGFRQGTQENDAGLGKPYRQIENRQDHFAKMCMIMAGIMM